MCIHACTKMNVHVFQNIYFMHQHMLAFAFAHLLWWFQFLQKPENSVPIQNLQLAIMQLQPSVEHVVDK